MIIRNVLVATGAALAISVLASGAFAAGTTSTTANASVTVVSPTVLTKTQDMAFGTVVRPSGANGNTTFVLSTANAVTATGGDGSVVASTVSSANFTLSTVAAITYSTTQTLAFTQSGLINISASAPAITNAVGTSTTVPANSTQNLAFGGQFDVTPTTTPQTYTGTLSVTVNYN